MADKIGKAITGYQNLVPAPQRQGGHRSSEADGLQVCVQIQVHIHGYTLVQGKYLQEKILQVRVPVHVHGHVYPDETKLKI